MSAADHWIRGEQVISGAVSRAAPRAAGGLDAATLADAMGGSLTLARYAQLLPAFTAAMLAAGITTARRAAMWCAQIGHESVGLKYQQEIWGPTAQQLKYDPASGSALSRELGNTHPGDGVLYRGHGWLMVTGRGHHAEVSVWAYNRRLTPAPTWFVDHPADLGSDRYAGLGAAWYWTVERPQLNALSDNSDLNGATRAVNGGLTNLANRQQRYEHCLGLGNRLLPAPTVPAHTDQGDPVQDHHPLVGADVDIYDVACGAAAADGRWMYLSITLFAGRVTGWIDLQDDHGGVGVRHPFDLAVGADNLSPRFVLPVPSGTTKARIGWDATHAQKACLTVTAGR